MQDDRLADAKSTSLLKTIDEPLDSDNTLKTKFGSSQGGTSVPSLKACLAGPRPHIWCYLGHSHFHGTHAP